MAAVAGECAHVQAPSRRSGGAVIAGEAGIGDVGHSLMAAAVCTAAWAADVVETGAARHHVHHHPTGVRISAPRPRPTVNGLSRTRQRPAVVRTRSGRVDSVWRTRGCVRASLTLRQLHEVDSCCVSERAELSTERGTDLENEAVPPAGLTHLLSDARDVTKDGPASLAGLTRILNDASCPALADDDAGGRRAVPALTQRGGAGSDRVRQVHPRHRLRAAPRGRTRRVAVQRCHT